jgi:dinuclear metal center YbgI/SA1388 family protein
MIIINQVIQALNSLSHPSLQESYDNCGLLTGLPDWPCSGIICALDVTEEVLAECKQTGANLIVAHHPVIFKPLKNISGWELPQIIIRKAIKEDIAIFAIHTNYDNVIEGVNYALALSIGLDPLSLRILAPLKRKIAKLYTYVPQTHKEAVRTALFEAGGGEIGNYVECSFETVGTGTFRPLENTNPFIGNAGGVREFAEEVKLEVIFPIWKQDDVISALKASHPYEEVAFEVIITENQHQAIGAGMIGQLPDPMEAGAFLSHLKGRIGIKSLRHNALRNQKIKNVAMCGGSGSFLIKNAMQAGADAFITADLKYHDFFEGNSHMLLVDAGHYETEITAIDQLVNKLQKKFTTFAVQKTKVYTNPVRYY